MIKSASIPKIFAEVVELASALLEGGNQDIQKGFFNQLDSGDVSQTFFKVKKFLVCRIRRLIYIYEFRVILYID